MNRTFPQSASPVFKAVLICAVSVFFAAAPSAVAQRGSHVGGHVGGGHYGFGGHVGPSAAARGSTGAARGSRGAAGGAVRSGPAGRTMNAPKNAYEIAAMQSRSGASTRGYSREVFVSASATHEFLPPASRYVGANGNTTGIGTRAYAANNYFWEAPPQQGRPSPAQAPRPAMPATQMPRPIIMPAPRPMNAPIAPMGRLPGPIYNPAQGRNPAGHLPVAMGVPEWHANSGVTPPIARAMVRPLIRPLRPLSGTSVTRPTPFIGMTPVARPIIFPRFHPFHPIGSGFGARPCFEMIGECDIDFGFGFGSPFFFPPPLGFGFGCFGFFNPCGIGFGPWQLGGLWGGYAAGNGWYYSPPAEVPPPPANPTEENPPLGYTTGYYFWPEVPYSEPEAAQPKKTVKLALKDGTIFDVYSYWLQDNQLYYITTYNIKTSIPVDDLDLQKTVDLNQKLGVTFTLSNKAPEKQPEQKPEEQ